MYHSLLETLLFPGITLELPRLDIPVAYDTIPGGKTRTQVTVTKQFYSWLTASALLMEGTEPGNREPLRG